MTKSQLIREVATRAGLPISETERIIDNFCNVVKTELSNGGNVTLRGFGTFQMKHRGERIARNIAKGTQITLPAKDYPSFKPSPQFLETSN